MPRAKLTPKPAQTNLASLIRGLYGRVARRLKVDPSYVSRVARGERQSEQIEAALERELKHVMSLIRPNRNGVGRRSKPPVRGKQKKKRVM